MPSFQQSWHGLALVIVGTLATNCSVGAFSPAARHFSRVQSDLSFCNSKYPISFQRGEPLALTSRQDKRSHKLTSLYSSLVSSAEEPLPKLDRLLSKLTSLFPLFVLGSAILGSYVPDALNWVNTGNYISLMLAG